MTTSLKYVWISPRGFANEGTLYSYDPNSAEQVAEIEALKAKLADEPGSVVNEQPTGVDFRLALPWEVNKHPERFKPGSLVGSWERI